MKRNENCWRERDIGAVYIGKNARALVSKLKRKYPPWSCEFWTNDILMMHGPRLNSGRSHGCVL